MVAYVPEGFTPATANCITTTWYGHSESIRNMEAMGVLWGPKLEFEIPKEAVLGALASSARVSKEDRVDPDLDQQPAVEDTKAAPTKKTRAKKQKTPDGLDSLFKD